ncbi:MULTISPECIES: hypothetical protein [unclassified Bacillus (in: firmicutes)]|uniref:hypothetical protein n=1 Tax=unclassified Bacillus (in: firmicutes) TaxID=185979 RepID=UPI0008EACC49|nr:MULTISPECIES: hypothetical protein [unclassified Bacillus (in: firmicutes)]SFJ25614.1 hypothetical protein SAMN04488574_10915 [Bacillus sp. 71mf]SFS55254.1 hypothetical protein SAMN04488145_1011211 [Bacillus sp. 103mf]
MKKVLNIIGAVLVTFVDGKKVALALNETEEIETGTSHSNNDITNTTFTLYPSHI